MIIVPLALLPYLPALTWARESAPVNNPTCRSGFSRDWFYGF
jgi:hypothetical protein